VIWVIQTLLFAQMNRWSRLGDGLRSSRNPLRLSDLLPYLLGLAVIGLIGTLIYRRNQRNDMSIRCNDPHKLFRELCLAHELDGRSQKLLRNLAEAVFPDQHCRIFLSPAAFDAPGLPATLRNETAEFAALKAKLFGAAS
jgi:hypothetical protein